MRQPTDTETSADNQNITLTGETVEALWNSNYKKVMFANFALFFAFYLLTPLLPLYLSENFCATKDVIGIVLSGYTITALLLRPVSGFAVDCFPRKKVLLICFALFALLFSGYLLATSLLAFTIIRTLHGGPFGALTVANSTVAIDVIPSSRRNEGIGYYGLSNNLAMAIAPSVGIYIYRYTENFQLLFWIAFIVALTGLAADASIKYRKDIQIQRNKKISLDRFFLTKGWFLGVNMISFGFCFGVLSNYLAIYSKETLGITSGTGTYFLICSIGLILSRLQGVSALRKGMLTHNAIEGMLISFAGYFLFIACPNELGYYASALLIGLGNGHLWPAFQNMIISTARNNERGTANSTILISWDIGIGLGILIGGICAEHLGYSAAFWLTVIVNTIGVVFFFTHTKRLFLRNNRNKNAC